MDALIQQFFNLQIMAAALPTIPRGLGVTVLICLAVVPLDLCGGLGGAGFVFAAALAQMAGDGDG